MAQHKQRMAVQDNNYLDDADYLLWMLLTQTRKVMFGAREKELAQYNISIKQSHLLFVLVSLESRGEIATPSEIARWMICRPHTVSGLLSRMVKNGLVKTTKDLERKNQIRVTLTEKGREVFMKSTKRASLHQMMSCLNAEERRNLRACLAKLRDSAIAQLTMPHDLPFLPY